MDADPQSYGAQPSVPRVRHAGNASVPRKRESSAFIAFFFLGFASVAAAADFAALDAAAGHALFERNWVAAPASTAASDGLGPYYNARSCAACHPKSGAGARAVAMMNLVTADAVYGELVQLRAVAGLKPELSATLRWELAERVQLDGALIELMRPELALSAPNHREAVHVPVALRRAPALHGLALLAAVDAQALLLHADPDDADKDGISGRLPADAGRFGWTAATPTLRTQIARALSLDLGLGTPEFPSAAGDCTARQHECLQAAQASTGAAFEAPATVVDLLLAYLASLPAPAAPDPAGAAAARFQDLGCAACHVPQLTAAGSALHAYTDLLLHDLGPGLAAAGNAEWRTAPLWGLGGNPAFLHDGRARTLDEAILWHGGEASASAEAYRKLNRSERAVLQAWLLGL